MGKQTVEHRCGHSHTYDLYGKIKDRERKADWLADQICPACRRKAELEAAAVDETPVTIKVSVPGYVLTGENLHLVAVAAGGTMREKENLKALGFHWSEPAWAGGGLNSLLGGVKTQPKAWNKVVAISPDIILSGDVKALLEVLGCGNYTVQEIDPLEVHILITGAKKAAAQAEAKKATAERDAARKAEIGISPIREKIVKGRRWNGKIYGQKKYGYKIYIDDREHKISAAIVAEQNTWGAKRDEINARYAAEAEAEAAEKTKA
jgi:hypothetical protein